MIIKNHTIELKDTSSSEMARFRQIMLGIWRQEIEDEKNGDEILQYLKEKHKIAKSLDAKYAETLQKPEEINLLGDRYVLNNDNHYQYTYASPLDEVVIPGYISPLTSILNWIKKNIGNNAKELKFSSLPKKALLDSLSETYEGHFIKCNRFLFEGIVDLKNIKFEVSFRPVDTVFQLSIFGLQKNLVFRFETSSYEGLEYLANFIGYDIDVFKRTITQQYKKEITAAGNDKDKLDIVYEVIPDFILASLKTDRQMYADIWALLDQNFSDTLGRDENKGILNILKILQKKDAKKLYEKLYERPLWVMRMYETFSGDDRKNFISLLMTLSRAYNHKKSKKGEFAVIPDGYWFKKSILTASWIKGGYIEIKGYGQKATNLERIIEGFISAPGPTSEANSALKVQPGIGTDQYINEVIAPNLLCPAFSPNPMDFVAIRTMAAVTKEQTLIEETQQLALFLKYTADELEDKVFWDIVNIATTLAGGSGAVRVLVLEGTGWLLKTAAVLELSKVVLDLVMLSDKAKQALTKAGLGILVDNWATISIATDFAFLSYEGLISLAKYGRKGAKVLKEIDEIEHAAHLEKQTEKAFIEIEKQTGIDVSKMSDTEIDVVVKNRKFKAKTIKELEKGIAKIKEKHIQEKLTNLLKQGDEVSQNVVQEYLAHYNLSNRIIGNVGVLNKTANKKVIQAFKERFAKFDILDAKGIKIDATNLTDTNLKDLFTNKYFMKYENKLIPIKFDAHHIIPKNLLLDDDMIELRNFVSRNKEIFDFNGLDNGIPVHKFDSDYPLLGGHSTHPAYSDLSKEKILEIIEKSKNKGILNNDLFDENLLNYINETREKIIDEVIADSKKINDLKL